MSEYANVVVHAFIIDGQSRGTVDCVNRALSADLIVIKHVITVASNDLIVDAQRVRHDRAHGAW